MLEFFSGLDDAVVERLPRGHSNESFSVTTSRASYVIRRSSSLKPAQQIAQEEFVLGQLAGTTSCDIPRIVRTRTGAPHAIADLGTSVIHLFTLCRGTPGPEYLSPADHALAHAAMQQLAALHRSLAGVPCGEKRAWAWLSRRLETVQDGFKTDFPHGSDEMLERIEDLIPAKRKAHDIQLLHGDYHLGNLLWVDGQVTGIVDFEETDSGSALGEAAMALFALARQPNDEWFRYDTGLWDAGLAGYGAAIDGDRDELMRLFCAYQVLIHLTAVQRKLWTIDAGIGFWPCWNTLGQK